MPITKLDKLTRDSHRRQYEIAGHCGIHPTTYSEYVRGIRPLNAKDIVAIANFFTVPPEEIIGWVEDSPYS